MTAIREKKMVDECLWLLGASEKEIADQYHKTLEQVQDFKLTRIEGLLYNISDALADEIEREEELKPQRKEVEQKTVGEALKLL